jgi:hypothetical protein
MASWGLYMEMTIAIMEQMRKRSLAGGFLSVPKLELSPTIKKYIFTTSAYVYQSMSNTCGSAHIFV